MSLDGWFQGVDRPTTRSRLLPGRLLGPWGYSSGVRSLAALGSRISSRCAAGAGASVSLVCGAAGVGGWDASACRGVLLCAPARPVGYRVARFSLRRCTCPLGPYTMLRGSRRCLWRAGAPILRGGGGSSSPVVRLSLIALLLAALVAAILAVPRQTAVAQAVPTGSEEVWSATLTVQSLQDGSTSGCTLAGTTGCAAHLTNRIIRIGSMTYRVTQMSSGNTVFGIATIPPMPQDLVKGWILIVDRGPNGGTSTYTLEGSLRASGLSGRAWSPDHTAKLTLYRPRADIVAEEVRKGATRSASACPGAVDAGPLWHCHGDAVFHAHGPEWRYRHPAPGQAVRATGDPPARPPATAPSSAADKAKGFGNWHSHPDGRFHRHAGGH